jgi:hypothetical protein
VFLVFELMANVMPDALSALALNELMPFFNVVVVHVTVVFAVLHVIVFLVAPLTTRRYFLAPLHFRNVTFTVRPLNVHFAERNEGVTTATGVPGATAGTVTTGDSVGADSEPPDDSMVVVVSRASGSGVVVSSEGRVVVVDVGE